MRCYRHANELPRVNNGFNETIRFDNGIDSAYARTVHFLVTYDHVGFIFIQQISRMLRVEFTIIARGEF